MDGRRWAWRYLAVALAGLGLAAAEAGRLALRAWG
jgi:hypothetical protein